MGGMRVIGGRQGRRLKMVPRRDNSADPGPSKKPCFTSWAGILSEPASWISSPERAPWESKRSAGARQGGYSWTVRRRRCARFVENLKATGMEAWAGGGSGGRLRLVARASVPIRVRVCRSPQYQELWSAAAHRTG